MGQQMFGKEIEGYQRELAQMVELMEKTRGHFVEATIACLSQWYQTQARYYVQDQYEHSLSLGPENLGQMKSKITQLVTMIPASVQRLLDDDNLWWHRCRDGGWRDPFMEGAPEPLDMAVKRLSALLTPILLQYTYIKPPPEITEVDTSKPKPRKKSSSRFAAPELTWSEKMTNSVAVYKDHLGRAIFLDGKIREATKLMKKYQAGALWDKV